MRTLPAPSSGHNVILSLSKDAPTPYTASGDCSLLRLRRSLFVMRD
jgi:hypothetical protein